MGKNKNKTAILILTHLNNKGVLESYLNILSQCSRNNDIYILCDNTDGSFESKNSDPAYILFKTDDLGQLPYPGKATNGHLTSTDEADWHHQRFHFDPGNVDLPILHFFGQHPDYDHYWVVEYDVRFSGAWRDFFAANAGSDADLLGTTLTRRPDIEDWHHWRSLSLGDRTIHRHDHIRGFFPIYRLSRRALERLDTDYRDGAGGHFECLIPTLLNDAGMKIEDIGGTGEFVRPSNVNRFYRNTPSAASLGPGTFVFRPAMDEPGPEPNMLWHPVRPPLTWRARSRRRTGNLLRFAGQVAGRFTGATRETR